MGNQYSTPDKDKEKEKEKDERTKEKERDSLRAGPRLERRMSKSITPSLLPPTETKVNAEQTHNNNEPKLSIEYLSEPAPPSSNIKYPTPTTPLIERRTSKATTAKDILDALKDMNLNYLPRPSEEEIRKAEEEIESTPKFETMKVPSQSSLVDEDEQREVDKSGLTQVPLILDWSEDGKEVAVAGTFTGWQKLVKLRKTFLFQVEQELTCSNGGFSAIIQVPPGTHRFHFLVDGEWRISNEFATAVDSEGNLLNYLEAAEHSRDDDYVYSGSALLSWPEPDPPQDVWTRAIPPYVAQIPDTPTSNGQYSPKSSLGDDDVIPPALPRQLEKPFLNQNHLQREDQSVLPIPVHVVLNHLAVGTSIKDNILAVSSTNRYRQKYVTSILYKQVDDE